MNESKHICNLEYCKKHSQCIYRKALNDLKANPYIVSLGEKESSDRVLCYEKEDLFREDNKPELKLVAKKDDGEWREIHQVELNKSEQPHCENPSCNSIADVLKFNGKLNLCYKCLDSLREQHSNHDLVRYFNHRHQLIKLLKEIEEINNPKKQVIVRCSNIYCGSTERITQHHLIPNPYRKGVAGGNRKIPLCWDCHVRVHGLRRNKELALYYNTKSAVLKLLEEDVLFRLYKMGLIPTAPALPEREMTMVHLDTAPSRIMAVAG